MFRVIVATVFATVYVMAKIDAFDPVTGGILIIALLIWCFGYCLVSLGEWAAGIGVL